MNRCVVIAAAPGMRAEWLRGQLRKGDIVLCADGGYHSAAKAGIVPDYIVGDFDSAPAPTGDKIKVFPKEKDDTDTMLAIKAGMELGCRNFLILGGIGSRLDHTFANLTALRCLKEQGCRGKLSDEHNEAFVIKEESVRIPRKEGCVLSVFSLDAVSYGVSLRGVKYPLEEAELSQSPLGVSNVILDEFALVSVKKGTLLLFLSRD